MTDVTVNVKKRGKRRFWHSLLLCVVTTSAVLGLSDLYGRPFEQVAENGIIALALCGLVVVGFESSIRKRTMLFNTCVSSGRFLLFFFFGICFMGVAKYIPPTCWPCLFFAVALLFCSGETVVVVSYCTILFLTYLISGIDVTYLILYLLAGMSTIFLFQGIGNDYRYRTPLVCSTLLLIVYETALTVFTAKEVIVLEDFVYPFINAFINVLLVLLFLKYYSFRVIHKNQDRYKDMTNPDYSLSVELKEYSLKEYRHALHTMYFCDKIAHKIDEADAHLCKAGGYYHRIGRIREGNPIENICTISREYQFPKELTELLTECATNKSKVHSKEAAIIIFADAVVTSVCFMFEKDQTAKPDYGQIVSVVLKKKIESGVLDECLLTMADYAVIKKTFVEEKLYYDFLR